MQNEFIAKSNDKNKRLDLFINEKLPQVTRSQIKNLIKENLVLVNNKTPFKAGQKLSENDEIIVKEKEVKPLKAVPENLPIDIIYQDEHLAVINKAQGMVVHPAVGNHNKTLVNALLYHFNKLSDVNNQIRPGIVHRLDKDTSGLLVIAKTNQAHSNLAEQIKVKSAKRVYRAILSGVVKEDSGVINKNLDRSKKDRKKIAVTTPNKGKTAITEFKVIKRFNNTTYVEFNLKTGRTHQIRVHAKHIGHPVLGDKTYGHNHKKIKLNGQLLHAYSLTFVHPETNKQMSFKAPLPTYFENMLKKLSI
jgi:23S rRNA pseudouridine1911/1915/1917 synthase